MKKTVLAILVFILLGVTAQAMDEEKFLYTISDGEVAIAGLSEEYRYIPYLVIPDEIENCPVTMIDGSAFSYTYLQSVTIPDTVKEIGPDAFYGCENLRDVTLPEQDIIIRNNAFAETYLYNDVSSWEDDTLYIGKHMITTNNPECVLKNDTLTIAESAFYHCIDMTSINVPASVIRIGDSAFAFSSTLESVTINEGTKYIDNYAFRSCSNLKEISLPDSIIQIGYNVFDGVPYEYEIINSAAYIGNHLIWVEDSFSGTYTVKEGTRSIASEAFMYMDQSNLQEIIFPKTLKGIGVSAFWGCTGLETLNLPSSVEYIGEYAFAWCENIKKIIVPGDVSYLAKNAFDSCTNLAEVYTLNKKWDYQFDDSVEVVTGDRTSPFPIKSSAELYELSKAVNSGMDFEGIYFVLENNISLNNNEWIPIGTYDNPFSGNVDGKNNTISDYKITKVAGNYTWDGYTGFFGYTSNASIKNLNLSDFDINISNPDSNTYLGSFAGMAQSTIFENCSAQGNIILFNNTNTAYEADIGGIVAQCNSGSIISTTANCNIYYAGNETTKEGNTQIRLGGISAYTYSQIRNCTSNSNIYAIGLVWRVGGIAGDNTYGGAVCISGCTANGKITIVRNDTNKDAILHCGGIAGFSRELIENSKSYVDIKIYGNKTVSNELVTNSFEWNGWYCGQIFGVGYSGGNFNSDNNNAYGSVSVLSLPTELITENIDIFKEGNDYEYSVTLQSLNRVSGKFLIALYYDDILVGIHMQDVDIDKKFFVAEGNITVKQTPNLCKVFVWEDLTEIVPLMKSDSIEL